MVLKAIAYSRKFGKSWDEPIEGRQIRDMAMLGYDGPDDPTGKKIEGYGNKCFRQLLKKGIFKKLPGGKGLLDSKYVLTEKGLFLVEKLWEKLWEKLPYEEIELI